MRGKTGVKLYDGKHFKELYAAIVEEADFTYGDTNMKTGAEIGYRFEYDIREDMQFVSSGYYRHFFEYGEYELSIALTAKEISSLFVIKSTFQQILYCACNIVKGFLKLFMITAGIPINTAKIIYKR